MTTTIDSSGESMVLRTRAGIDLQFVLELVGVDLAGYTVAARIFNGDEDPIDLDTTIDGSDITVTFPHEVTATLPSACTYSVAIVDEDALVTGIVYGPLYTNTEIPA